MAGLSTTHIHSSITRTADASGDLATSNTTSGWGRVLSDVAHGSGAGLRYFEVEVVARHPSLVRIYLGVVDNTSNLGVVLGGGTESALSYGFEGRIHRVASSSLVTTYGLSDGAVGMRALVWVDCATRKIWGPSTDYRDGNPQQNLGNTRLGRIEAGLDEYWTIPGTGDLRVCLSPLSQDTVLRFRSRYTQLRVQGADLLGALPWDARSVTLVEDVSGVANGTTVRWAWFDQSRPDLMTLAATTTGTATVTSGQVSVTVNTSLDMGGIGSLLLSTTDGTIIQCRSHYAPAAVP